LNLVILLMLFYDRSCNYASGTYRKSRVEWLSTDEAQLSTTKSGGIWNYLGSWPNGMKLGKAKRRGYGKFRYLQFSDFLMLTLFRA
jgi:hypothetical protein